LTLALAGGCTSCPAGVHLHNFSCKLGLKIFFSPTWGVQVHPLHPLAMPMFWNHDLQNSQSAFFDHIWSHHDLDLFSDPKF